MTIATSHDQDRYLVALLTRESDVMGEYAGGDDVTVDAYGRTLRGTVVGPAHNQLGQLYGVAVHFDALGETRGVDAAALRRLSAAA